MLHNMWPLMLGQKPLKCQEKSSGVYKMPRTPLGELTALPQTPSWWERAGCLLPKNPTRSRPFMLRLRPLGLASAGPEFSNPLRSKILHTALAASKTLTICYPKSIN